MEHHIATCCTVPRARPWGRVCEYEHVSSVIMYSVKSSSEKPHPCPVPYLILVRPPTKTIKHLGVHLDETLTVRTRFELPAFHIR